MRKRKMYLSVEDIAELFGLSVSFAYRVVERMNADLESKNYYVNGNCLLLDDGEECVCVQSISYSLLCRWFQAAVLPLDAALYAEIIKDRDEVKRCCECGATFQPKSNRAKYCAACAKRMRRRKEAERQRKRYWQHEA